MAKGYHVLAGLCRDLGNAIRDDADGSASATELLDTFDDVLELLYDRGDGEVSLRQEGDDSSSGDDSAVEDEPVLRREREQLPLPGVGGGGQRPTVHSTRTRAKLERRGRATDLVSRQCGVPHKVGSRG